MEAKDKARELVNRFLNHTDDNSITQFTQIENAKKCAIICVDEIIKALRKDLPIFGKGKGFWNSVKKEIELL